MGNPGGRLPPIVVTGGRGIHIIIYNMWYDLYIAQAMHARLYSFVISV